MGGATKISVCFNGIKSVNINLIARLSVVYILHCDEHFYKYTRKLDFNVEPAISFFLKMSAFLVCCIHSNALQTRFFHGANLGPYCLQYKLHNKINSKLHKNINRLNCKGKQNNIRWQLNCHPLWYKQTLIFTQFII